MILIDVPDMNDSISLISLGEKQYYLRFTYNSRGDFWSFGVYSNGMEPIIPMTKIVPNFPLHTYYVTHDLPDGVFAAWSTKDHIGRYDFFSNDTYFGFIPNEELQENDE